MQLAIICMCGVQSVTINRICTKLHLLCIFKCATRVIYQNSLLSTHTCMWCAVGGHCATHVHSTWHGYFICLAHDSTLYKHKTSLLTQPFPRHKSKCETKVPPLAIRVSYLFFCLHGLENTFGIPFILRHSKNPPSF